MPQLAGEEASAALNLRTNTFCIMHHGGRFCESPVML